MYLGIARLNVKADHCVSAVACALTIQVSRFAIGGRYFNGKLTNQIEFETSYIASVSSP